MKTVCGPGSVPNRSDRRAWSRPAVVTRVPAEHCFVLRACGRFSLLASQTVAVIVTALTLLPSPVLARSDTSLAEKPVPAKDLDNRRLPPPSDYTSRAWQTDEGLPHNLVRAITQTSDGYLWVGTRLGLARFDGLHFTTFNSKNTPALKNSNISALCVDRDGSLWIGTFGGGLVHLKEGVFSHYGQTNGLAGDEASVLCAARDGTVWLGTTTGLTHLHDGKFTNYTRSEGLASDIIRSLLEDREGNLWIATGEGLHCLRGGVLQTYTTTNGLPDKSVRGLWQDQAGRLWLGSDRGAICYDRGAFRVFTVEEGLSDSFVNTFCEDREGNFWVGTYSGLNRFKDGKIFNQLNTDGVAYDLVNALFEDHEGTVWVGSREGLARLTPKRFFTYTRQKGLSHNNIMSVMEDRSGSLWIGTWGGGLNQLKDGKFTVYSTKNGLAHDLVLSTCESRDGSLWIGADFDGGLTRLKDGNFTRYTWHDGLLNAAIRVLHEDRAGSLWIGTSRGLNCLRDGKFTTYTVRENLAGDAVRAICEDHQGNLWFGTEDGLSCWKDGQFTNFTDTNGLPSSTVLSLYEDDRHNLWIGTEGGGLVRRRDGKFSAYTMKQGLLSDDVFEILEDDYGCLWMSCLKGISRVSKNELNELDPNSTKSLHAAFYGRLDGLLSVQCNGVSKPAGCKSRDGRLWFPTTKGLVAIDPRIKLNPFPPPVVIEEVLADKKLVTGDGWRVTGRGPPVTHLASPVTIPPGRGELEFHYTALSLQKPEKNRFKYLLEGVDPEWVDAETRRVAYYNHLHPGSYRFRVIACNNDGVWNEQEASMVFVLQPVFWQTGWFIGLTGLGLVGSIAGSVRYVSVKRLQRKLAALQQQAAIQKERARIAKDIHDDLGASLTQITLLSDRSETEETVELRANTRKISNTAREMAQSLDEIVWAVNPEHDTLEGLVEYLSQSADDFLEDTPIRSRVKLPSHLPHCSVPAEVRHQLFLAFKEALNNAVKHAGATEIEIEFVAEPPQLQITVADNGKGFAPSSSHPRGNGLYNMRKRLESLGGQFDLTSRPAQGTEIKMSIPLERNGQG
jgi:ligand-binding sensor domain-containing protein/signal transduction histidine kinase